MEKTLSKPLILNEKANWIVLLSVLGCCLITLCSLVKIPFYPVPFTMQTFAVALLGLTQSPKQAAGSVMCYLMAGTIGLPIFCGNANSLWIVGKHGGYLIGFLIAAYLISKLARRGHPILGLLCGQAVIYILGFIWLTPFFGAKIAFTKGVVFFIPACLLKNLAALGLVAGWKKWAQR